MNLMQMFLLTCSTRQSCCFGSLNMIKVITKTTASASSKLIGKCFPLPYLPYTCRCAQ
jgi:hypothetical protein